MIEFTTKPSQDNNSMHASLYRVMHMTELAATTVAYKKQKSGTKLAMKDIAEQ